jgi:site-specific DNA recombinase
VGASANGKRNRYYMCSTRQRYGPTGCTGERVRADELEAAVFAALIDVYSDPDLLRDATAFQVEASTAAVRHREDELMALDAELAKAEAAIERYMGAFENGTITEDMFGERVRELGVRAKSLRAKRAEAAMAVAAGPGALPTPEQVLVVRDELKPPPATPPTACANRWRRCS